VLLALERRLSTLGQGEPSSTYQPHVESHQRDESLRDPKFLTVRAWYIECDSHPVTTVYIMLICFCSTYSGIVTATNVILLYLPAMY
jgi:hypothetical protein